MEIKTKFNIGDNVYIFYAEWLHLAEIIEISISKSIIKYELIYSGRKVWVGLLPARDFYRIERTESECFATREEMLVALNQEDTRHD